MVAPDTAAASPPALHPPSMGPASIPYTPPMTLGDAVIRARVRIRLRNRRGSFALLLSVVLLGLPLILSMSALFPQEPGAEVPLAVYLEFLGIAGAFLFFTWAIYRILRDRTAVTYPLIAAGATLLAYAALQLLRLVQLYGAWNPTDTSLPADPNTYLVAMIVPGLTLGSGLLAVLGGALALPRRVDVTQA